ncbi:hypothetical protein EV356DRAFT_532206 [Viridothelium virens]|uniref:R3H domain-containing protein n=1 Tax=Viridothelium virens TaxID=1048519 RepID=A0A6A6HAZ0_VIRVR|nr:hypothetical protein EV356DRAFT_532206 [Viridothelium virens]
MASRTTETSSKPSFAKVAASAYVPPKPRESTSNTKPPTNLAEAKPAQQDTSGPALNSDSQKPPVTSVILNHHSKDLTNNDNHTPPTSVGILQARDQQHKADTKSAEGPRRAEGLLKAAHGDDGSTQLSSDSSAKPPSLDGKSVTSGTTFALDEKESLRPDDSASVKATDEEDVFSPPSSNAPGSRVGSDHGTRAFHDQLHEIAAMGPVPNRGPPVVKVAQPPSQSNGPPMLFNPSIVQSQPLPLQSSTLVGTPPETVDPIPDEKLLEAVESPRDRLFVMKLEQDFIDFVKDKQESSLDLPQCNGFYRMLAHRLADYYLLGHALDSSINAVRIYRTPFCRIPRPLTGPSNPSTSANTPPPNVMAPKIMRRGDVGNSKTGNHNGHKAEDLLKVASNGDGDSGPEKDSKPKVPRTREEKEIAYKQAKERIFGPDHSANDVAEKTNVGEEKDNSRSSSANGKKKGKNKQRKNSDDGFELRSQYEPYYPSPFPMNGFGVGDGSAYTAYSTYNTVSQQSSPTGNLQSFSYSSGYPAMVQQAPVGQNTWQSQQFPTYSNGQDSQSYGPVPDHTFNLNSALQQMSFQPHNGYSPQPASNYGPAFQDTFQEISRPTSQQQQTTMWSQVPYQTPVQSGQLFYPGQTPYVPQASQSQNSYPYGQLPQGLANGKSPQNQHPVPGSFNRQQFNPQSQSFVPHQMVASAQPYGMMPQMSSPSLNNLAAFTPANNVQRQSSSQSNASFGSPRIAQSNGTVQRQPSQVHTSFQAPQSSCRSPTSSNPSLPPAQNPQSTIAKWGAPASLPPKPPPSAVQSQLPKVNDGSSLPPHPYANGKGSGGSNGVLLSR